MIHGLVKRPLVFTFDAPARYPMTTRVTFIEFGGNSGPLFSPQPLLCCKRFSRYSAVLMTSNC